MNLDPKASDLNTAVTWLLSRDFQELPARLQPAANQLRMALQSELIERLFIWYVHNLPESKNVEDELKTVETTAHQGLAEFPNGHEVEVIAWEVGRNRLTEWYAALETPIMVNETFQVGVDGYYFQQGDDWSAVATSVPARWLHEVYQKHRSNLFSANIRGYLGSRRSDKNINNGIKETAEGNPVHFWIFNNGLTILVHQFEAIPLDGQTQIKLSGLSIVNGAQTTGALGNLKEPPSESAMVPVRFVRSDNHETLRGIIRYNNSQNRIEASDFRSNDQVQNRLRAEFNSIPNARYFGGRRGGDEDAIRRPQDVIPSDSAAQSLVAFHQDPITAYNNKSEIWSVDTTYGKYFTDYTTAKHLIFCHSLLRTVERKKAELVAKSEMEPLSEIESKQLAFLRRRGATFLLVAAIGKCMEVFLGKGVPNLFSLSFGEVSPEEAQGNWAPLIDPAIAFVNQLDDAIGYGLQATTDVSNSLANFQSMINATKEANNQLYSAFAAKVVAT